MGRHMSQNLLETLEKDMVREKGRQIAYWRDTRAAPAHADTYNAAFGGLAEIPWNSLLVPSFVNLTRRGATYCYIPEIYVPY